MDKKETVIKLLENHVERQGYINFGIAAEQIDAIYNQDSKPADKLHPQHWYANKTDKITSDFDAYDHYVCKVVMEYVKYLNQNQ